MRTVSASFRRCMVDRSWWIVGGADFYSSEGLRRPLLEDVRADQEMLDLRHSRRKILNQEKTSAPRSPFWKTLFEAFPLLDGSAKIIWSCGDSTNQRALCTRAGTADASQSQSKTSVVGVATQLRLSTPAAYTFSFNSLYLKDQKDTQDCCLLPAPCAAAFCPKWIHVRAQTVPTSMATRRTHNKTRLGCHQCKRRRIKV